MPAIHKIFDLRGTRVIIRSAAGSDAAELVALVRQLDTESIFLSREPGEFSITVEQEEAYLKRIAGHPLQSFLVAEVDGKIVGTCHVIRGDRQRTAHVADLAIAIVKAYWDRGIGRALMETNIAWLLREGAERVVLAVDTENLRAFSLYTRLGFMVEGTLIHNRKLADGSYRDDYRMALDLINRKEARAVCATK